MGRTLKPEDRIAHYRVVGPLGAGGMGEVYRAKDVALERDVALKILPPDLFRSDERVRRFMLEAKSASSLNHPNIVTIYEIGEDRVRSGEGGAEPDSSPLHYISMELVNGKTLSAEIHEEKADLKTLLGWLAQAAEGLSKAHAAGIVHRDLKPGNIMISSDGYAKVLDFGLAKLTERQAVDAEMTAAPTMAAEHTSEGVVLGTAGYMAPEQVQGKVVDPRADVFAFGCMLYEAATRRRPFAADSKVETMHRILHDTPVALETLNAQAPAELRRLIRRCLAKDPNQRLDSMKSLALELREIVEEYDTLSASASSGSAAGAAVATPRARRSALVRMGSPLVVSAIVVLAGWLAWKRPWESERGGAARPPEWKQVTSVGKASEPDISPDGGTIAYVVGEPDHHVRLMVQDVKGGEAIEVFRGVGIVNHHWSGTGSEILVTGYTDSAIGTWLIPRMGGQRRAMSASGIAQLSPDGALLAQWRLSWRRILLTRLSSGDTSRIELKPKYTWLNDVEWSPDGKKLLVVGQDETRQSVWTIQNDGRNQQNVYEGSEDVVARWAPRGNAIYCLRRSGQRAELIKVYLRRDGSAARKSPRVLVSEPALLAQSFGISGDGRRLICARGARHSNLWLWEPPGGARPSGAPPRQLTQGAAFLQDPVLSPDGQRVAFLSDRGGTKNVHLLSLVDGSSTQLTFLEHDAGGVVWSPDGKNLAFTALDGDTTRVWRISSAGGSAAPFKRTRVGDDNELAWSPGNSLLYGRPGNRNFNVLDPATETERPLVASDSLGWMFLPAWSPDGKHVVVFWNRRTGPSGLWVVSPDDAVQRRLWEGPWIAFGVRKWSGDGSAVLGVPDDPPWRIIRFGFPRGDTTTVIRFPVASDRLGDMDFTPDLRRVVYAEGESNRDIWLLENFDSEVK